MSESVTRESIARSMFGCSYGNLYDDQALEVDCELYRRRNIQLVKDNTNLREAMKSALYHLEDIRLDDYYNENELDEINKAIADLSRHLSHNRKN